MEHQEEQAEEQFSQIIVEKGISPEIYISGISSEVEIEKHKEKWIREQRSLKMQLVLDDLFDWNLSSMGIQLSLVGGVDISFLKEDPITACASLVVLSFPSLELIFSRFKMIKLKLPYVSTFLAFREVPFLSELLEELKIENPSMFPQVLLVDGNGLLHPEGFGLACHLGVLNNLPTIGIGKTFLMVDGLTINLVKKMELKLSKAGESVYLIGNSGTVWGAVRIRNILVSAGKINRLMIFRSISFLLALHLYRH